MMNDNQDKNNRTKSEQTNEYLEQLRKKTYDNAIDDIMAHLEMDKIHGCKRIYSFEVLDGFLDCCKDGVCPLLDHKHHKFLIDISVHGYYKERAYYYSLDQIGVDNDDRYLMAVNKVDTVFKCRANPELNDRLFEQDLKELEGGETGEGARRRKAFWRYLERIDKSMQGDPDSDFYSSVEFIRDVVCNPPPVNITIDKYKQKWKQSLDVVSGLDLYRFCHNRKLLSNTNQEVNS
jgi:hypothetical protein